MQDVWRRFEAWLAVHAPQMLEILPPGATEEEIRLTEETLSVALPEDFKASYRIHDGQETQENDLVNNSELFSLARVREDWRFLQAVDEAYEPQINADMVPFAWDGDNHYCLDLAPDHGGKPGQIIELWEYDWTYSIVASHFRSWFTTFIDACEAGQWAYSEKHGSLMEVERIEDDV